MPTDNKVNIDIHTQATGGGAKKTADELDDLTTTTTTATESGKNLRDTIDSVDNISDEARESLHELANQLDDLKQSTGSAASDSTKLSKAEKKVGEEQLKLAKDGIEAETERLELEKKSFELLEKTAVTQRSQAETVKGQIAIAEYAKHAAEEAAAKRAKEISAKGHFGPTIQDQKGDSDIEKLENFAQAMSDQADKLKAGSQMAASRGWKKRSNELLEILRDLETRQVDVDRAKAEVKGLEGQAEIAEATSKKGLQTVEEKLLTQLRFNKALEGEIDHQKKLNEVHGKVGVEKLKKEVEGIGRMITLGCPLQLGSIDDTFDIPAISLPNMSCADALSEVLRWVPDAVVWFDYSVATGTGYPSINVTRRIAATSHNLTAGSAPVASANITPRLDLKVDQIKLLFATHNAEEKTIFVEVSSGHSGTAQAGGVDSLTLGADASESDDAYGSLEVVIESGTGTGQTRTIGGYVGSTKVDTVSTNWTTNPDATSVYKVGGGSGDSAMPQRQIVPITGPEISDSLPKDYFENEDVKSAAIPNVTAMSAVAKEKDPMIAGWIEENGAIGVTMVSLHAEQKVPITVKKDDGSAATVNYYMVTGDEKAWFETLGIETEDLTVSGEFAFLTATSTPPTIIDDLGHDGWYAYGGDWFWRKQLTFNITGVSVLWAALTTVYRKQDYEFVNPPDGLAFDLLQTQNWTPYEGDIQLRSSEVASTRLIDKKINLSNSLPEHVAMGAMANEVVYDIAGLSTTLYLGAPARLSYKSLVRRFRQPSRDNFVYL